MGQKAYNGVAVLGRIPFTVTHRALPGLPDDDAQARYMEVEADGITIVGIYLPNGNSRGEDGFAYKLAWMDRLADRAAALLEADTPAGHHRRLQRRPDRRRTTRPARCRPPTPWSAPKPAPASAACSGWA